MSDEAKNILTALGFTRGTGFDGEVWTNTHSEYMAQVWVWFSGDRSDFYLNYNSTDGFNLNDFFKWWELVSIKEREQNKLEEEAGSEW